MVVGIEHSTDEEQRTAPPLTEFQVSEGAEVFVELDENVLLEPVSPESYDLSYTCLIIPRFPSHQLKGDLAVHLPQWLSQICLSYSWRLGFTNVHPEYLQWSIRVSPSVSPGKFIHLTRTETSKFTFEYYPRFKRENLSDDFWAPGYLVILGMRPHPEPMVEQFIRLTRRQQGLIR
jgi:REP element-mobilizing transposase RayT